MMALLFLGYTLGLVAALFRKRSWAIFWIVISLLGSWLMMWHHATDMLKVRL